MSDAQASPHLPRRIIVGGTTGAGKTTAARRLSTMLGYPHIELDALFWEADWTPAAPEVFRARVETATAAEAWVADGGYSMIRDLTWGRADTFVWLDYSYPRVLRQLAGRTFGRIARNEQLWNGNRETVRNTFFSRDSLFVWQVKTLWDKRRRYPAALRSPAYSHLRVVRARHPDALERWLRALERSMNALPA